MKEKENGHIWILNGKDIARQDKEISKNSIFFNKNLNKLGFTTQIIGDEKEGFSYEKLKEEFNPQPHSGQKEINLIISAHGSDNRDGSLEITLNAAGSVKFEELMETLISITMKNNLETTPLNIIVTSCHGKYAHNSIQKLKQQLPLGSKIITLSNYDSSTLSSDSKCSEVKLNELIETSNSTEFKFIDLLKLQCLTQTFSQNTPTIGTQTSRGYSFIDLNEVTNIPASMYSKNSEFLEEIFNTEILSKNNMENLINDIHYSNSFIPKDGLKYWKINLDEDITDNNFLKQDKLNMINSYFFKSDLEKVNNFNCPSNEINHIKKLQLDLLQYEQKCKPLQPKDSFFLNNKDFLKNEYFNINNYEAILNTLLRYGNEYLKNDPQGFFKDLNSVIDMLKHLDLLSNLDYKDVTIENYFDILISLPVEKIKERIYEYKQEMDKYNQDSPQILSLLKDIIQSSTELLKEDLITKNFLPEGVLHPHTKYGYLLVKAADMVLKFENFEQLFAIVELGKQLKEIASIVEKYTKDGVANFITNIDQHVFSCYDKSGLINHNKLKDIDVVMGLILDQKVDINSEFSNQLNFLFENYATLFERANFIETHQNLDDFIFQREETNSSDDGFCDAEHGVGVGGASPL